MKGAPLHLGLLAASLLAAYGVARADTVTTYSSNVQLEPKCMDAANTKPVGCIPSVPAAPASASAVTSDSVNGTTVVPGPTIGTAPSASTTSPSMSTTSPSTSSASPSTNDSSMSSSSGGDTTKSGSSQ